MAYNDDLARRIREILVGNPGIVEKRMFGGVGFMLQGNMACGVNKDDLIVRVGADDYPQAISQPFTRPFDFTGRPMQGWVMVSPEGYVADSELKAWVDQGVAYALSLPAK